MNMTKKLEDVISNSIYTRIGAAVGLDGLSTVEEAYQKNPERTMEFLQGLPLTADLPFIRTYITKNIIEPHRRSYPKTPTLGDKFGDLFKL